MRRACLLAILATAILRAQAADAAKLAPYYPTPETIVEQMLKLGALKAGEKMFDLGSGDGRIVIMAAQKFHADAVGVELDKDSVPRERGGIRKLRSRKERAHRQRRSVAGRITARPT